MAERRLLRGGVVLTMDPDLGDLPEGDVLIEGDAIAAVGPALQVDDAEVSDASGRIVLPCFIDTHRHTWETAIRGCAPNATLDDYFVEVLEGDVYIHSCYFDDEEWQLVKDTGGHISIAAQVELQMGHGCPPTGASRRARQLVDGARDHLVSRIETKQPEWTAVP